MFGVGLSLTSKDFKNIFMNPRALVLGLSCQLLILPLIAIFIAYVSGTFSNLSPKLQLGIVLIAACPGGAVSNLITHLLSGNTALSVSLTTINSLAVVFSIPIIVKIAIFLFIGGDHPEISLPFWSTLREILLITVIPCLLGVFLQAQRPVLANALERPLKFIMPFILAFAMLGAIFLEKSDSLDIPTQYYFSVTLYVILLNVVGMALGYYLAKWFRLGLNNQMTIAIEVGLQNTALAITIATSSLFLGDPLIAIPASIYALFTFFSAAVFGVIVKPELLNLSKLLRRLS